MIKKPLITDQHFAEAKYANGPVKNSLPEGEKERPIITKLCNHIQDLCKVIPGDPEYNALACCVSDDEAKVALLMKVRKHYTTEDMVALAQKKYGMDPEDIKKHLTQLAWIGVIMVDPKDPHFDGKPGYWVPIFVPGIMEVLVGNQKNVEEHPIIAQSFAEYTIKRIMPLSKMLPVGKGVMRVVPIYSAIKDVPHEEYEDIHHYIDTATDICVSKCSCRVSRRLMGEGCGHLEDDMCIQLNEAARSFIDTGRARAITKEEAYAIMDKAEKNGLMHETPNTDGVGKTHAICNCCGCSCFSLRCAEYFHTADMVRSNFISTIDPTKCVACGECVEVCPMNALKLGERLENKNPIKIEQPKTPDNKNWGKEDWNPNFRFDKTYVLQETGTAPCKMACPAHIAIEGYLELAREGKYEEALALIKKKNPFPAVCGRVCNKRCEDACTRGTIDKAVSIDEVKKFLAEQDLKAETRHVPEKEHDFSAIHMAVIGAGPSGLSCAYYLAVKGYSVTVFEKEKKLGGMLTLGIPSFRLQKDVIEGEIECLKMLGVEFKTGVEVGKDVTIADLRKQGYKAFYVAIGAQGGRKLGVPNEDAAGVISGVDFLRGVNLGTAPKLSGKVLLMGGGNVAIDVARTAKRWGAESVDLYCLESRDIMTAAKDEIAEAEKEGIKINNSWGVKEFHKDAAGKLTEVVLKKCTAVFDKQRMFNPTYDENNTITVKCDYFLAAIGQSFVWGDLLKDTKAKVTRGRLEADTLTLQTAEPDIFTGGDCFHGTRFAIDAIANGLDGAESMHRYAHPGQSLLIGRAQNPYEIDYALDKDNIDVKGWDNTPRAEVKTVAVKDPMADDRVILTADEVTKECGRCLKCGRTFVDESLCVGCGQCTTKCKFNAITLKRRFDAHGVDYSKEVISVAPSIIARGVKVIFSKKGKTMVDKDKVKDISEKKIAIR
jgi:NADPH-dependent glutamate synthase beta subunit-like oxidoreductase/NAD-dependent dihydropyrimidine dehydrogenase PreA subunit